MNCKNSFWLFKCLWVLFSRKKNLFFIVIYLGTGIFWKIRVRIFSTAILFHKQFDFGSRAVDFINGLCVFKPNWYWYRFYFKIYLLHIYFWRPQCNFMQTVEGEVSVTLWDYFWQWRADHYQQDRIVFTGFISMEFVTVCERLVKSTVVLLRSADDL